jgi:hypothetical protein
MESRWNDNSDSRESKEKGIAMDIKNLDELRAAYPALVKPIDEENAALKSKVEAMEEELTQLSEDAATLLEEYEGIIGGVREAVGFLIEMNGVIPGDDDEEEEGHKGKQPEGDEPEAEEPEGEGEPEGDEEPTEEQLKDLQKALDAGAAAIAELATLKESLAKDKRIAAVLAEMNTLLAAEDEGRRGLVRAELVDKDGAPLVDTVEKLKESFAAAKTKVGNTIIEIERQKIVGGGAPGEKGHVASEAKAITEEQAKALWSEAKAAGYKGDLNEYKQTVLKTK